MKTITKTITTKILTTRNCNGVRRHKKSGRFHKRRRR